MQMTNPLLVQMIKLFIFIYAYIYKPMGFYFSYLQVVLPTAHVE